jgi:hypothetical protein
VIRQMLVRAINDLVVAFHLMTHGYLNQAYNVMRTAYEACDVLDLVAQDPNQAELWITSERPQRDFAPAEVRRKLGRGPDPIYSAFCGASHPRFEAVRLTAHARPAAENPEQPNVVVRMGPFLIDDHPAIGHTAAFLGTTVGRLSVACGQLLAIGAVSSERYESSLNESARALARYMSIVSGILIERGQPEAADVRKTFQAMVDRLAADE